MFDTTNNANNTRIKLNSVSGTLFKTHEKSFFERFHLHSESANYYFGYSKSSYVILQVMMCGDMEVLVELVRKSDYENGG